MQESPDLILDTSFAGTGGCDSERVIGAACDDSIVVSGLEGIPAGCF